MSHSRGHLLPSRPLDYTSDWVCEECGHTAPSNLVQGVVELYKHQIQTTYETDRQSHYSPNTAVTLIIITKRQIEKLQGDPVKSCP